MSHLPERGQSSYPQINIVESQRVSNARPLLSEGNWIPRDNIQQFQNLRQPIRNHRYQAIISSIKKQMQLIDNMGKYNMSNMHNNASQLLQNSSQPIEYNQSQFMIQCVPQRERHQLINHNKDQQLQKAQYQKCIEEKSNKIVELLQDNKKLKIQNQAFRNSKLIQIKNRNNSQEETIQELKKTIKLQTQEIAKLKAQNQTLTTLKNNHIQSYEILDLKYKQKESDYHQITKNYYSLETKMMVQKQKQASLQIENTKLLKQIQLIQRDKKNSITIIQQNKEKNLTLIQQQYQQKYQQFEELIKKKDRRYQLLLNEFKNIRKTEKKVEISKEQAPLEEEKRKQMQKQTKEYSTIQKKENLILLLTQQTHQYQEKLLNSQKQLHELKMKQFERDLLQQRKIGEKEETIIKLKIELKKLQSQNKTLSQNSQEQFFSPITKQKNSQGIYQNTADERNSRKSINHLEVSEKEYKQLQKNLLQKEFQTKRQIKLAQQKQKMLIEKYEKRIQIINNQIRSLTIKQEQHIKTINLLKRQQEKSKEVNNDEAVKEAYREQISRLKRSLALLETDKKNVQSKLEREKQDLLKEVKTLQISLKNMHQINDQIDHLWEIKNKELANTTDILKEMQKHDL